MSRNTVAPRYNRSGIFSWYELTDEQQERVKDCYGHEPEFTEEASFVLIKTTKDEHEPLPLDMFMRTQHSKVWHGVYGTSAFSAYFIRFNRSNDEALVAERFS